MHKRRSYRLEKCSCTAKERSMVAALDSRWLHEFEAGQALENQGATCYINSTVQCIVHNPFLANLALGGQLQLCQCRNCVLCYLNCRIKSSFRAVAEARKGYPAWMVHTGIKQLGTHSHDRLSATRQEDAHDFLRQWLGEAHDCHERLLHQHLPKQQVAPSIIDWVYGGVLASRVQCQQCWQVSSKYDAMNDLSVEVDDGSMGIVSSVQLALTRFVEPEVIDAENAYFCECCNRKQTAHKSLHIHTAPNTLTLHLKRFRPDFIKLTGHIAFPLKLDLSPYLSPDSPDLSPQATGRGVMYRLIAVLIHTGAWSCAGHYFAYVLDSANQWWMLNDDMRYKVDAEEVLHRCEAYMLFYIRIQPRQHAPVVPKSRSTPPSSRKRYPHPTTLDATASLSSDIGLDSMPIPKRFKLAQPEREQDVELTVPQHAQQDQLKQHATALLGGYSFVSDIASLGTRAAVHQAQSQLSLGPSSRQSCPELEHNLASANRAQLNRKVRGTASGSVHSSQDSLYANTTGHQDDSPPSPATDGVSSNNSWQPTWSTNTPTPEKASRATSAGSTPSAWLAGSTDAVHIEHMLSSRSASHHGFGISSFSLARETAKRSCVKGLSKLSELEEPDVVRRKLNDSSAFSEDAVVPTATHHHPHSMHRLNASCATDLQSAADGLSTSGAHTALDTAAAAAVEPHPGCNDSSNKGGDDDVQGNLLKQATSRPEAAFGFAQQQHHPPRLKSTYQPSGPSLQHADQNKQTLGTASQHADGAQHNAVSASLLQQRSRHPFRGDFPIRFGKFNQAAKSTWHTSAQPAVPALVTLSPDKAKGSLAGVGQHIDRPHLEVGQPQEILDSQQQSAHTEAREQHPGPLQSAAKHVPSQTGSMQKRKGGVLQSMQSVPARVAKLVKRSVAVFGKSQEGCPAVLPASKELETSSEASVLSTKQTEASSLATLSQLYASDDD